MAAQLTAERKSSPLLIGCIFRPLVYHATSYSNEIVMLSPAAKIVQLTSLRGRVRAERKVDSS
jgi:hypothetical protein